MVLHNYIREHSIRDMNFANYDQDPNFVSTITNRYNKYVSDDSTSKASFLVAFRD
jgi:hypothetical protein